GVLAVDEGVRCPRVDDEQVQPRGGEGDGDVPGAAVPEVEEQRVPRPGAQRGGLVHAAGGGPGDLVLRADARGGEPRTAGVVAGEAQVPQVVERDGGGALERGRRGEP